MVPVADAAQELKKVSSIMASSAIYKFVRNDFQGTVLSMQELADCNYTPVIDVTADAFSSSWFKILLIKIQAFLFEKEFHFELADGEPADKFKEFRIQQDLATSKVFTTLGTARIWVDAQNFKKTPDRPDAPFRLYFAGDVSCIKTDKCYVAAVVRVLRGANVMLALPVCVEPGSYDKLTAENKESCSVLAWNVRQAICRGEKRLATQHDSICKMTLNGDVAAVWGKQMFPRLEFCFGVCCSLAGLVFRSLL